MTLADKFEHYLYQLNTFHETLQAGLDALDQDGRSALTRDFSNHLDFVVSADALRHYPDCLHTWNDIIETAIRNGFAPLLSEATDDSVVFSFGRYLLSAASLKEPATNRMGHALLDLIRHTEFMQQISTQERWQRLILDLIVRFNFNTCQLIRQRIADFPERTLFGYFEGAKLQSITWRQAADHIDRYARGLHQLLLDTAPASKVAFLLENSPEMAFLDLACLSGGIVNVMIPANSVPSQIEFILNETRAAVVLISNDKQLAKLKSIKHNLHWLQKAVLLEGSSIDSWVLSFDEMVQLGLSLSDERLHQIQRSIKIDDLATIMYTSGTTGEPKGIMFSHQNIVYKRYCRALALPEIGMQDRYLAYLPLYHTFGRWLEMMGAVFWGAEYIFMDNPSLSTMIDNFRRCQPTIFISIPKKWMQLYEYIAGQADLEFDPQDKIKKVVEETTGGRLKWGLSAAGYLDPQIFRFFQGNGIQLMSGFGMTEATGGITMTQPGEYRHNSLGQPLPGIEVRLDDDGEMLIRGPYVMMGYYGQGDTDSPFRQGWFPTGDIMRQDKRGWFEIVDRKKEIYKNIKGETIAPQRVENYFQDFDHVQQVFLVGDHRPYNTVLIYPNDQQKDNPLKEMTPEQIQAYFSSVIVTVNNFLASFERILDFRLIDRPFSADMGELTPKGTYKRRAIEQNFADLIEDMYKSNYILLHNRDLKIKVPNWFLREKGCLTKDIRLTSRGLEIEKASGKLVIKKIDRAGKIYQIGDYQYKISLSEIDLQAFLANPSYWLGNRQLAEFTGPAIFTWYRMDGFQKSIEFIQATCRQEPSASDMDKFKEILEGRERSLFGLDLAMRHLQSSNLSHALLAVEYLRFCLLDETLPVYHLTTGFVKYPGFSSDPEIRRELFKLALPLVRGQAMHRLIRRYIAPDAAFLNTALNEFISKTRTTDEDLHVFHTVLKDELKLIHAAHSVKDTAVPSLLELLAEFGIAHPTKYKRVRQLLVRYQLRTDLADLAGFAARARSRLQEGFRGWLGENQHVSVDMETGNEYEWKDVIIFEEDISLADRKRMLEAISSTSLLREAIFLFSEGGMVRLYDIPLGGIWISTIDIHEEEAVYRVSVQTRYQGSYDFVVNIIRHKNNEDVQSEINWLIHAGAPAKGLRLVEDFGGFWPEYNLWTEDFITGDSVARYLRRSMRRDDPEIQQRLHHIWPFFVWTAMNAHHSFCRRTGYQWELEDKSIDNIVIPSHDYQTGVRLLSIARRKATENMAALVLDFYQQFVLKTEQDYPFLKREKIVTYVFSGLLDGINEEKGLALLQALAGQLEAIPHMPLASDMFRALNEFLAGLRERRFIPKALFFAIKRFFRWKELNVEASYSAQARTLNELYETYRLAELEKKYAETRTRFFLETVFADSADDLRGSLMNIVNQQAGQGLDHEQILTLISNIYNEFSLDEKEKFFLSRLSYPHLKPTDRAVLVSTQSEGTALADVVVRLEDYDGNNYQVRKPVSPKEISRLHQLFLDANLPVNFRPEHRFLIAISERGYVIGGLFYSHIEKGTIYMEKVVVADQYRRKGISEGLMNEFFNRLRNENIEYVTTGFFRPEYFYRFGFKIERKYSGLVKELRNKEK